jgi:hypothetical protein
VRTEFVRHLSLRRGAVLPVCVSVPRCAWWAPKESRQLVTHLLRSCEKLVLDFFSLGFQCSMRLGTPLFPLYWVIGFRRFDESLCLHLHRSRWPRAVDLFKMSELCPWVLLYLSRWGYNVSYKRLEPITDTASCPTRRELSISRRIYPHVFLLRSLNSCERTQTMDMINYV